MLTLPLAADSLRGTKHDINSKLWLHSEQLFLHIDHISSLMKFPFSDFTGCAVDLLSPAMEQNIPVFVLL